jgi:hypothetical protein
MPINTRNIANRRPVLQMEKSKGKKPPEFLFKGLKHPTDENVNEETESTTAFDMQVCVLYKKSNQH